MRLEASLRGARDTVDADGRPMHDKRAASGHAVQRGGFILTRKLNAEGLVKQVARLER